MINLSPGFVGIGEVFDRVGGKLDVKLSQVKLIKKLIEKNPMEILEIKTWQKNKMKPSK